MAGKIIANKGYLKRLGLKLRKIRNTADMTLEEVEERGYPSWRHLQQIEGGKINFTVGTLLMIAKIYKIEPWEILKGLD